MSVEINLVFETECGKCYGTAAWMEDKQCDQCKNTGRVATSLGEQLLEFLEHQRIGPVKEKGEGDE